MNKKKTKAKWVLNSDKCRKNVKKDGRHKGDKDEIWEKERGKFGDKNEFKSRKEISNKKGDKNSRVNWFGLKHILLLSNFPLILARKLLESVARRGDFNSYQLVPEVDNVRHNERVWICNRGCQYTSSVHKSKETI